ncbi:putative RNA-directed RNA polymerase [Giardia duodenalis]|uniref:RNA-directed RNA polymerase n=2 Tax=Giardia intestinalis TaxID=5741 RepID=E2RTV4_GIAIC|nr:putative RNA-directed RNA polymerase [Giardia intestinalis]AAM73688.1 RNA dependent RNA polymerase [Giardia intestinalis]KAE8303209.1 putative RNA-directed RNA polymerase [Giardia intestinalis]|eukprot:XP_001710276.1 RNA-directed RNA polymerase, putative [Giardia lamblia ATCC 50803]
MPSASELHAQYPYIAPSGCFPPRGFDFPLLSLSFPLRYALDQFHLNSAGFRALDQSRIIIQLYDLQVSAIENDEDEISLLLAAYNYLVTECHKVDPIYAQEVLDDLVVLHNGQLEGEHKQALIYINTSTVSKDSYSSVFSVYTDDRTDASHSNLFELGLFTHLDHFATMSGPHIHSPLRLRSVLGAPNPKNISALVFKVIIVIIATKERVYALLLPQTPILEMSSRHLREFGSRHLLRVEFAVPRSSSSLPPQRSVSPYSRRHGAELPDRTGSPAQRRHKVHKKPVMIEERIQHSIARAGFPSLTNRRFARSSHSSVLKRAIYNILTTGVYLGGSVFVYYAQGSGQLKEQQCWFIRAPDYELMYRYMQRFTAFIRDFKYYQSFYANLSSKLYTFYVSPILPSIDHLDSILNKFMRPRAVIFREFAINWLGDIKEVQACKICTRRGLCFGKSLPTIKVREEDVQIVSDKEYNGYVFTDGAGEISYDLMLEIALCLDKLKIEQLHKDTETYYDNGFADTNEDSEHTVPHLQPNLKTASNLIQVPSAVQMRWAGTKGVLILNALLPPRTILFHKSQVKFSIPNPTETQQTLEILRVAQPSKGMINMQIIVLLSEMGVPDDVFLNLVYQDLQKTLLFLEPVDRCRHQADLYQLVSRASHSSSGKLILQMLMAGVDITEPCLQFLLMKLQMMQLRSMKANMRFYVPDSRIFVGVYDCFDLLKEGEVYVGLQEPLSISKWAAATHLKAMSNDTQQEALLPPDLDLQISDIAVGLNISCVEGRVVVAKNPCFYRGDVRIYHAVNIFERLRREASRQNLKPVLPSFVAQEAIRGMYRGVICFPKYYEGRPMTDCLSGSDLDGDIYWVSWDASLLGTIQREYEPASFQANPGEIDAHALDLRDIEAGLGNLLRIESDTIDSGTSNWPFLQELKLEQFYNLSCLLRKSYVSAVLKDQCSRGVDLESKKLLYSKINMEPVELILREAFILEWVSGAFFDKTIGRIGSELKIVGDMLGYSHPLTMELGRQFFFAIDADKTGWRRKAVSCVRKLLAPSFKKLCQSSQEDLEENYLSESSDFLSDCGTRIDEITHYTTDVYATCLNELADSASTQPDESTNSSSTASDESDGSRGEDGSLRFIFSDTEGSDGSIDEPEPHLKVQSPQHVSLKHGLEPELRESSLVNPLSSSSYSKARAKNNTKRISLQKHGYKLDQNSPGRKDVATNEVAEHVHTKKPKAKMSLSAIASAHAALAQLISSRKRASQVSNQATDTQAHPNFPFSRVSLVPNWMIGNTITGLLYPTDNDWLRLKNKIIYHSKSVAGSIYNLLAAGENNSVSILRKCIEHKEKPFFQAIVDTLRPVSTVLPLNLIKIKDSIETSMAASLASLSLDLSQLTEVSTKDSLMLLGIQNSVFRRQIDISVHIFGSVIADFNSLSRRGKFHTDIKGSGYSRMTSVYSSQMRKGVSDEERRARAVILYYLFYTYALLQLLPTIRYCEQMYGTLELKDVYSDSRSRTPAKATPSSANSASGPSTWSTGASEGTDDMSQTSSSEYKPDTPRRDREHRSRTAFPSLLDSQMHFAYKSDAEGSVVQYLESIATNRALIGISVASNDRLVWSRHTDLPSYKTQTPPPIILCNRYSVTGIPLSEEEKEAQCKLGGFSSVPAFSDISKCLKSLTKKKVSTLPSVVPLSHESSNENGNDMCLAHHLFVNKLPCNWPVSMTNPTIAFSRPSLNDNTVWLWENAWKSFINAQLTLLQSKPRDLQEVPVSALTKQNTFSESYRISVSRNLSAKAGIEEPLCMIHEDLIIKTFNGEDVLVLQEQLNSMIQTCVNATNTSSGTTPSSNYSTSDKTFSTILSEDTPAPSEQSETGTEKISENSTGSYRESSSSVLDDASPTHNQQASIFPQKMRPTHTLLPTGKLSIKDSHSGIDISLQPIFFTRSSLVKINESPNLRSSRFARSYPFVQRRYVEALQICQLVWDICGPELCEAFARCRHQYMHALSPEIIPFVNVRS